LVPGGPNPFLWDEVDGFTIPDDPTFPSGFGRRVSDVYADGFVGNVAGSDGESIGYRWTEESGFERLSDLVESTGLAGDRVIGVSEDGGVLIGKTSTSFTPIDDDITTALWDETHGWQSLEQVLIDSGIELTGWKLSGFSVLASDISADGSLVVGTAINPDGNTEAYLADLSHPSLLPGDYNADRLVDQADLDLSLLGWGADASERPEAWIRNLPEALVDQAELDAVLLNWGAVQADPNRAAGAAAAVPEPASSAMLTTFIAARLLQQWARRKSRSRRDGGLFRWKSGR
jgi:hypothetical protein